MKKINPINLVLCTLILFEKEIEKIEDFETIITRSKIIDLSIYELSKKTISRYMSYIKTTLYEYKEIFNIDIEISKNGYKIIKRDKIKPIK